jgi:hypothetical protein
MHDEGEDADDRSSDDEDHGPSKGARDTSGRTQIGTARPTPERTSSHRSVRSNASASGPRSSMSLSEAAQHLSPGTALTRDGVSQPSLPSFLVAEVTPTHHTICTHPSPSLRSFPLSHRPRQSSSPS